MPARVTLTVEKGEMKGSEFVYTQKESVVIGRMSDNNIVLPEKTVSRYHCMMDILPPSVTVRDFYSLNGTYLNDVLIGQREAGMSAEQARGMDSVEFDMKDGDRLRLGKDCEIQCTVWVPESCSECGAELPEYEENVYQNECNQIICALCHQKHEEEKAEQKRLEQERIAAKKAEQERKEAQRIAAEFLEREKRAKELAEKRKLEQQRIEAEQLAAKMLAVQQEKEKEAERQRIKQAQKKCELCGQTVLESQDTVAICPACQQDPIRLIEFLFMQAAKEVGDAKEIKGYKRIEKLGEGGMGEVWLVKEESTGKQMALKLMLPEVQTNQKARDMFMREAFLAQQLKHPNVVNQISSGNSGDTFFMLMEFCQGGTVDDLMKRKGGVLPVPVATNIMLQVLDGLIYTHNTNVHAELKTGEVVSANGIVHRDFKAGNIFLADSSDFPVAKVADFGLAKAFETAGFTKHTRTGEMAGTPVFMPRQQILNYRYAKPDVDVWAAAATYYYMLTGRPPKDFSRGGDMWKIALVSPAVPILLRNPTIPPKLAAVIDEALVETPQIGISTAALLKKKIEDAL